MSEGGLADVEDPGQLLLGLVGSPLDDGGDGLRFGYAPSGGGLNSVLLSAGVASIILAVVGGGAQAFGVTVPVLTSPKRQAALGLVGITFLVLAFAVGKEDGGAGGDDRRRTREIQSSLVRDVRQAVNHAMLTGESLATRTASGNAAFNAGRLRWENDTAKIATQLETYFSTAELAGEPLPTAWMNFSHAVENLYFLSATEIVAVVPTRCDRTKQLMRYLRRSTANLTCPNTLWSSQQWGAACTKATSWNALALCDEDSLKSRGEGYRRGPTYFTAYRAAIGELRERASSLLAVVRKATPTGF
jgi:hypothetical protein